MRKLITICVIAVLITASGNAFAAWTEVGDAGELPGTAQVVSGSGPLTGISGTISEDADMYQIYISDALGFSAQVTATNFDTQLFLFDASGMGVYANDDNGAILEPSLLPAGHPLGPTSAGTYYLAISAWDYDAYSSGGLIFPSGPFTEVVGPTEPGGGSPISSWSGLSFITGDYSIALTGAEHVIPAPGALLLATVGLGVVGWLRRRRTL